MDKPGGCCNSYWRNNATSETALEDREIRIEDPEEVCDQFLEVPKPNPDVKRRDSPDLGICLLLSDVSGVFIHEICALHRVY